jgi:carboxypeptidase Q
MKAVARLLLLLCISISVTLAQLGQLDDWDMKIINEETKNSELMKNLEYLCDMIGPRMTGSERMKKANEWTADRFKEYDLENVHLESWAFGVPWIRGAASARVLKPNGFPLTVAQQAWTPGTNGPRRGKVALVDIKEAKDIEKYEGKLRGAWVLAGEPAKIPALPPEERKLRLPDTVQAAQQAPLDTPVVRRFRQAAALRDTLNKFWKSEEIAGIIRDAGKEHALLNMTGSPRNFAGLFGGSSSPDQVTQVFMIHEHYAMLSRLLKRGEEVIVEMNLQSSYGEKPVEAYNTVAEIPGSEKRDEIVLLGAHLDSWDLGQGTTDNGTGSMTLLEVARILKAIEAKPKRTIRFVLFSGEEQGLLGSRAYVDAHKDELSKISVCLVMDIGSGKLRGIALQQNEAAKPIMDSLLAPFRSMGVIDVNLRTQGGTDHLSFDRAGVPGFAFIQDPLEYGKTHHSQSDTFDHASEEDLRQAATVWASLALKVANLPTMLPRKPMQPAVSPTIGN